MIQMARPKVKYPRIHKKLIKVRIGGDVVYFKVYKRRRHTGYVATPSKQPHGLKKIKKKAKAKAKRTRRK